MKFYAEAKFVSKLSLIISKVNKILFPIVQLTLVLIAVWNLF